MYALTYQYVSTLIYNISVTLHTNNSLEMFFWRQQVPTQVVRGWTICVLSLLILRLFSNITVIFNTVKANWNFSFIVWKYR